MCFWNIRFYNSFKILRFKYWQNKYSYFIFKSHKLLSIKSEISSISHQFYYNNNLKINNKQNNEYLKTNSNESKTSSSIRDRKQFNRIKMFTREIERSITMSEDRDIVEEEKLLEEIILSNSNNPNWTEQFGTLSDKDRKQINTTFYDREYKNKCFENNSEVTLSEKIEDHTISERSVKNNSSHEEEKIVQLQKNCEASLLSGKYGKSSSLTNDGEEGDIEWKESYRRLDSKNRAHIPDWYGKKMEKLGKQGLVYEAIEVLEKEMLLEDRVMPNVYVFNTLLGILGRVGYTSKSFKLFNKMKKFGITPDDYTYTALFNSCSYSPYKQDGLARADKLRLLIEEKKFDMNIITRQASIKVYARLGDLVTAFRLVDQSLKDKCSLSPVTYAHLLMACLSDKKAGLSFALKVWHLMEAKKIKTSIYHFNLLVRIIKECSFGNTQLVKDLIEKTPTGNGSLLKLELNAENQLVIRSSIENSLKLKFIDSNFENQLKSGSSSKISKIKIDIQQSVSNNSQLNNSFLKIPEFSLNNETVDKSENYLLSISENKPINNNHANCTKEENSLLSGIDNKNISSLIRSSIGDKSNYILLNSLENNSCNLDQSSVAKMEKKNNDSKSNQLMETVNSPSLLIRTLDDLVSFNSSARLCLFGGFEGVLILMKEHNIKPDIKTFTLLLQTIHDKSEYVSIDEVKLKKSEALDIENRLIRKMEQCGIKMDVPFCNLLIRARNLRNDFQSAKNILIIMDQLGLHPDLRTFGCLAMGCSREKDAFFLLNDIEKLNLKPTVEIMNILLYQSNQNFDFKLKLIQFMEKQRIRPDHITVSRLEQHYQYAKRIILKMEKGNGNLSHFYQSAHFLGSYERFKLNYSAWLKRNCLEPEVEPWDRYKQPTPREFDENDDNKKLAY